MNTINDRVDKLETEMKKNLPETENSTEELMRVVLKMLHKYCDGSFNEGDINDIFRIGKKGTDNCRLVLLSFVSYMKVQIILRNKLRFKEGKLNISRDFPKTILAERKRLQPTISNLNQSEKRTYFIEDQAFVDGKKLTKEEVEEEIRKDYYSFKRTRNERSPETYLEEVELDRPPKIQAVTARKTSKPSRNMPTNNNNSSNNFLYFNTNLHISYI